LGYRSVTSVDGTRLRAWDNDGHGVPVLISNGLGTPHHAWPDINRRTDTYRVMTWDHRGLGGSERPSDESRINISDHTDDLFAVMDSYGIDRSVVIGWSAGVNVAFEAALREPQRIAGVLAVAGVPGGTFEALLHPLPGFLRPRAGGWDHTCCGTSGRCSTYWATDCPARPSMDSTPGAQERWASTSFTAKPSLR
jgi:3-oxoadipate enol-lactonase